MFIIWKNKGILIPIYVISSFIVIAILSGILKRNVGGVFANDYDYRIILGLGFLISGIWTYLTSEEYIKKDGQKIKVNIENKFFFISMKIWGYIITGVGLFFLLYGLFLSIITDK
jgi:hypothetical protein